jgi:uncharacterized membrane protein YhaH (DUF805 family)
MNQDNPFRAPQFDGQAADLLENRSLSSILFSFEGRIPRRVYWGATLATVGVFYVIVIVLMLVFGSKSPIPMVVILVLDTVLFWISLAVQAKRWHDRDKSGLWILINFIPIIGGIWSFVEVGCLRGTEGPNQYGADPT